jgi:CheY-like chemotaxis protein
MFLSSFGLSATKRILVVDDEPMMISALERILLDYDVASEPSPESALARIAQGERFDAILCDIVMPGLTGIELHGRIAAISPAAAARMIFMTGYLTRAKELLGSVKNRCLEKPFAVEEMRSAVQACVGSRPEA